MPLRVALVGSSVVVGTPAFTTLGIALVWHRLLPRKYPLLRSAISLVIGGGFATLLYEYVGPFLANHSEVVLPFAASNGAVAAFWYTVLESTFGVEAVLSVNATLATMHPALASYVPTFLATTSMPLGGLAVGGLTALTAGYVYPRAAAALWPTDLQHVLNYGSHPPTDFSWMINLHHELLVPVSLPTGLVMGAGMHWLLRPILLGANHPAVLAHADPRLLRAVPTPATALAGTLALGGFYFLACGSYDAHEYFWQRRIDVRTGAPYALNIRTGQRSADLKLVAHSQLKAAGAYAFVLLRNPLKVLGDWWFGAETGNKASKGGSSSSSRSEGTGAVAPECTMPVDPSRVPFERLSDHAQLHVLIDSLVHAKAVELAQAFSAAPSAERNSGVGGAPAPPRYQLGDLIDADLESSEWETKIVDIGASVTHLGEQLGLDLPRVLAHVELALLAEQRAKQAVTSSAAAHASLARSLNSSASSGGHRPAKNTGDFEAKVQQFRTLKRQLKEPKAFLADSSGGAVDEAAASHQLELLARHLSHVRHRLREELGYEVKDDPKGQWALHRHQRKTLFSDLGNAAAGAVYAAAWPSVGAYLTYRLVVWLAG